MQEKGGGKDGWWWKRKKMKTVMHEIYTIIIINYSQTTGKDKQKVDVAGLFICETWLWSIKGLQNGM